MTGWCHQLRMSLVLEVWVWWKAFKALRARAWKRNWHNRWCNTNSLIFWNLFYFRIKPHLWGFVPCLACGSPGLRLQASVLSLDTVPKHSWKTWIKNRPRYQSIFGPLGLPVAACVLNCWRSAFHFLWCWVAWFLPPSPFLVYISALIPNGDTRHR